MRRLQFQSITYTIYHILLCVYEHTFRKPQGKPVDNGWLADVQFSVTVQTYQSSLLKLVVCQLLAQQYLTQPIFLKDTKHTLIQDIVGKLYNLLFTKLKNQFCIPLLYTYDNHFTIKEVALHICGINETLERETCINIFICVCFRNIMLQENSTYILINLFV